MLMPPAHARESCIRIGTGAYDECDIAVTLPPLNIKSLADGAVNFHFPRSPCQHPGDESMPLVNLCLCAFPVQVPLARADESAFWNFHHSALYFWNPIQ
jgi:hypothetical protein